VLRRQQRWERVRTGSDWFRTEANFGRIRIGSDCIFFENWRIRAGSDWENFCCFNVIILNISKIVGVIRFYRFVKVVHILPLMAKALLGIFGISNCIHPCPYITIISISIVNTVEWVVSISVEHDPVSGSRSNRILQFRTRSGLDWISKKLNRIKYGYPNCIDHCSIMLNQSFSDINRIGSNIWTGLPD